MFQYEYDDNNIINENSITNVRKCSCGLRIKYNKQKDKIKEMEEYITKLHNEYKLLEKKCNNLEKDKNNLYDKLSYDIIEPLYNNK